MPLLNYTTTIDPHKTLGEIQRCLVAHGARGVMTEFADGQPSALSFVVPTAFGDRSFRLPANVEAVLKTLKIQYQRGKMPGRFANREQAARVGWRIVKDWVEAQLAIVESGMVSMDEVFLPYMLVAGQRTMYEVASEQRLGLPAPGGGT